MDTVNRNNEPLFKRVLWLVLGRRSKYRVNSKYWEMIFGNKTGVINDSLGTAHSPGLVDQLYEFLNR